MNLSWPLQILTFTPGISIVWAKGYRYKDLVTCRCPKFLPLIRFLSFNRASAYFRLISLTITLLSRPLLFLERESQRHPSISLASTFIPDFYSPNLHRRCCSVCLITLHHSFGYAASLLLDFFLNLLSFLLFCCSHFCIDR